MRIVVQRVKSANVQVDDQVVGKCAYGLLCLVCLEVGDDQSKVEKACEKILKLRIFPAVDSDKFDQNIQQIKGSILAISQFTLSWRGKGGHRPGFDQSMEPQSAHKLFEYFCQKLKDVVPLETGSFGKHMEVTLINNGPVTFILDF